MKKESVNPAADKAFVMKGQQRISRMAGKDPRVSPEMMKTGAYCVNSGESMNSLGKKLFSGIGEDYPIK